MRRAHHLTSIAVLSLAAALQAQSPLPPGTYAVGDAPAALRPGIARGDLIVASMQDALIRELNAALDQRGPEGAIQSCHVDVIGVTQRFGRQEGLAVGRTADRLRSPTNAPKAWAAPMVQANAGRRARDVPGFAVDLGDKVGLLRPIAHRPMCGSCHGAGDQVGPAVRAALKDRYPSDRATGFEVGEIRGWFWVEIPKPGR